MKAINDDLLTTGHGAASKGMWPRRFEIAPGTVLYRFVDLQRASPRHAADGPWWFEYEHFQSIKMIAQRHSYSLGYAARLFSAILYEWSEVNAVVRASVKAPLVAWKGRGKPITVAQAESDARDRNRIQHGLLTERQPQLTSRMTPCRARSRSISSTCQGLACRTSALMRCGRCSATSASRPAEAGPAL